MRSALAAALAVLTLYADARGHAQDAVVPDLVSRASRYVEGYERQLSAVVSEERQTQRVVKSDGTTGRRRELVSDLLMVRTADPGIYGLHAQMFRDVIAVDAKPIRNRQERLRKLFLAEPGGLKQAQAISVESARHNIGFNRDVDILMLPLAILHAGNATGFRFARTADGLTFDEFRSPSLEWSRLSNGPRRDLFLHGTLTIDGSTGRLSGARLAGDNGDFALAVDIRYAEDAAAGLLVPVESREEYRSPKSKDRTEVSSTYSNFRRFQVTVDDRVKVPQPDR